MVEYFRVSELTEPYRVVGQLRWLLFVLLAVGIGFSLNRWVERAGAVVGLAKGWNPSDRIQYKWTNVSSVEVGPENRDPFAPATVETGRKTKRLARNPLQGIVYKNGTYLAYIDGKLYRVGNWVRRMRILKISPDKVILANNQKLRIYYLF